jgi:hypothetical protein
VRRGTLYRSCGARPSRLRSSNVTAGGESSVEEALIELYLAGDFGPARGGHHRGPLRHAGDGASPARGRRTPSASVRT